jgi:ligand-binding sensor domain-containing protein
VVQGRLFQREHRASSLVNFLTARRALMPVRPQLLAFSIIGVLLLATGMALLRFTRNVDRTLTASRQAVIDQHSVYLKSRVIIPQAKPGFSLFPARLSAREGVFFRDHLFVTSNLGLIQFDQDGREVRRYTALDGLPSNHLTALAKTADALWIAVGPQGLLKFTGAQFEFFYAERASDFEVTALLALPSGELWVGTKQRGLLVFQNDRAVEFAPAIGARFITALHGDHQQAVIGTFNEGAWVYRQGILSQFRKSAGKHGSLLDDQVTTVAGNLEAIYAGTPLGATEIRNGRTSRHFADGLTIRALTAVPKAVAATDQGLVTLNASPPQRGQFLPAESPQRSLTQHRSAPAGINSLLPASNGWLALADSGIFSTDSLERGVWRGFSETFSERQAAGADRTNPFELSDTNLSALAFDQDGSLWVGYFDRGLDVFDSRGKRLLHHEDDRIFCVNHLLALPDGRMAVSTANGLAVYSGTQLQNFITEKQGLIHKAVAMTCSLGGTSERWLAATAEGVSIFEGGRPVQNLFALHGLASNHVYCAASPGKRVYLGTLGGISVLEDGRIAFSWNTANSGLAANWVNALAVLDSSLFIGTYGGGIQSVDADGRWTDYGESIGRFEVNPNAMAVDDGRLYTGTLDRGVQIYDNAQGRWQQLREGLPSQNVTALAFAAGRVLVGTDRGLVEIRKGSF